MLAIIDCTTHAPACATTDGVASLVPLVGKPILSHILDRLVSEGVTRVALIADVAAAELERLVGDGTAWGIRITVDLAGDRQAASDHRRRLAHHPAASDGILIGLGHVLPPLEGLGDRCPRLWIEDRRWTGWATILPQVLDVVDITKRDRLPDLPATRQRICPPGSVLRTEGQRAILAATQAILEGTRDDCFVSGVQVAPGVWCGPGSQIHPSAQCEAPVWIGSRVSIGPNCHISAASSIGDGTWVGSQVQLSASVIASDCAVPSGQTLEKVVASGRHASDGIRGVIATAGRDGMRVPLLERGMAAVLLLILTPLLLLTGVAIALSEQGYPIRIRHVTAPRPGGLHCAVRILNLCSHDQQPRWWQRWCQTPALLAVVSGHLRCWGIHGIDPLIFRRLSRQQRHIYLSSPIGAWNDEEHDFRQTLAQRRHTSRHLRLAA